ALDVQGAGEGVVVAHQRDPAEVGFVEGSGALDVALDVRVGVAIGAQRAAPGGDRQVAENAQIPVGVHQAAAVEHDVVVECAEGRVVVPGDDAGGNGQRAGEGVVAGEVELGVRVAAGCQAAVGADGETSGAGEARADDH